LQWSVKGQGNHEPAGVHRAAVTSLHEHQKPYLKPTPKATPKTQVQANVDAFRKSIRAKVTPESYAVFPMKTLDFEAFRSEKLSGLK
jgi:hypothetical protein